MRPVLPALREVEWVRWCERLTGRPTILSATILISDGEGSDPLEATVTGLNTFPIDAFTLEVFGFVVTTDGDGSINSGGQLVMNVNADIAGFGSTTCVFTGAK